jgi:hypothetical protein
MYTRFSCLIALLGLACMSESHATSLPVPTVQYSADRIVETDAGTFEGKVYSARDRERTETSMQGMQSVMILRRDQRIGWMLMPAQKMYQEMDFAKAQQQSGAAPDDQVEITEVGTETVEGHDATKYKMLMKDGSAGGFIWITGEGIPVKMDFLSKSDGKKTRITMTLRNLEIGDQDPQLFELPAGYSKMPAMGFGFGKGKGLGGLLKGAVSGFGGSR